VEGLVIEPRRGDSLRIGELQVRVPRGASIEGATDARRDQRVRVTGTPNRRGITAEQIELAASAARSGGQTGSSEPVAERRLDAGKDREQGRGESVGASTFSRPERSERMDHDNAALARAAEAPRARAERSDIVQRSVPAERSELSRTERSDSSRTERSEVPPVERRPARAEHTGRPERTERSERSDRPEKSERAERSERPEKPERSERAERSERSDRPVRVERAEKPEKPERLERPELPRLVRAAL
jgi:transcription termination factor Rho